ncbi:protein doublesex-like, partial [Uranotaenia lowii]|uniref:protein doublesex-like n=1 Tax=Uranotaenia lowii TaxID=190385 RepID=UPI002479A1DB
TDVMSLVGGVGGKKDDLGDGSLMQTDRNGNSKNLSLSPKTPGGSLTSPPLRSLHISPHHHPHHHHPHHHQSYQLPSSLTSSSHHSHHSSSLNLGGKYDLSSLSSGLGNGGSGSMGGSVSGLGGTGGNGSGSISSSHQQIGSHNSSSHIYTTPTSSNPSHHSVAGNNYMQHTGSGLGSSPFGQIKTESNPLAASTPTSGSGSNGYGDYMNNCLQSGYFGGTFGSLHSHHSPHSAAAAAAAVGGSVNGALSHGHHHHHHHHHSSAADLAGYHHQHNVIQAAKLMASS